MGKLSEKKLFLLDMDGTLYLDGQLFEGTLPFLRGVQKKGGKYLFLTNNSSKSAETYKEKLKKMGIDADVGDFVTSVQVTARYLKEHCKERKIYVCGTESLKSELRAQGLQVTDRYAEDISCLLCGFDTELTFKKLDDCCRLLTTHSDLVYLATNPDWVCPTAYGYVPDCGSVCEMLLKATGRKPLVLGKPEPHMVYMALEQTGYTKKESLLIGDRLYTDIACALRAGIDGAFVLSGEGKTEDIERTGVNPTYIYENIGELAKDL